MTFEKAGTYVVTLTVGDSDRSTDKASITVVVNSAKTPLQANIFTPSGTDIKVARSRKVTFWGTGIGGKQFDADETGLAEIEPYGYFWDISGLRGLEIGDDDSTAFNEIDITFLAIGVYTIPFTVTDSRGVAATDTVTITVIP